MANASNQRQAENILAVLRRTTGSLPVVPNRQFLRRQQGALMANASSQRQAEDILAVDGVQLAVCRSYRSRWNRQCP